MSGRMLKIGLHCHSVWSYDGYWSLPKLSRFFGRLGYDAVMMTEHDTGFDPADWSRYEAACQAASMEGCRLVPGIEYSSPDNDIHIVTWGLDRFLAEHRPVVETLQRVKEEGGVAVFAHPARRDAWRRFDPEWTGLLDGMELWNRKTDGVAPGREAEQLIGQTGLFPMVGMDFHRLRHFWPLHHTIETPHDSEPEIGEAAVAAIRAGRAAPYALGTPLLDASGQLRSALHSRLEGIRRSLRGRRPRRRP